MTPKLRTRHRLTWLILAIVLPILFVLAIRQIPEPAVQGTLYQAPASPSTTNP